MKGFGSLGRTLKYRNEKDRKGKKILKKILKKKIGGQQPKKKSKVKKENKRKGNIPEKETDLERYCFHCFSYFLSRNFFHPYIFYPYNFLIFSRSLQLSDIFTETKDSNKPCDILASIYRKMKLKEKILIIRNNRK